MSKEIGMKWFHLFYNVRSPLAIVVALVGCIVGSVATDGEAAGFLIPYALLRMGLNVALIYGYFTNKEAELYPLWMYKITQAIGWVELSPIIIFVNMDYFSYRKYLFCDGGFLASETGEKIKEAGVVNCSVFSEKFGFGRVLSNEVGVITVAFENSRVRYPYPAAFEQETLKLKERKEEAKRKETKKELSYDLSLMGKKVFHKNFGEGTVVAFGDKYEKSYILSVNFKDGLHRVLYPHPSITIEGMVEEKEEHVENTSFDTLSEIEKESKENIYDEISRAVPPNWLSCHPRGDVLEEGKLVVGKCYGTNAQKIFLQCCDMFGWDESKKGHFGPQTKLYSYGAANGKSPWFLLHHSWVENREKKFESKWWNTITNNLVYEEWRETGAGFVSDFSDRITFAKAKNGYVYIGVFRSSREELFYDTDPIEKNVTRVKRYRLVQEDYEL